MKDVFDHILVVWEKKRKCVWEKRFGNETKNKINRWHILKRLIIRINKLGIRFEYTNKWINNQYARMNTTTFYSLTISADYYSLINCYFLTNTNFSNIVHS